ncbi:MAG: hypothetical protein GF355_09480 [Candidatus Eisenbacteria bacterium]|nr:hypothetical protein [Candidatus Eisenbacteria bacterium]
MMDQVAERDEIFKMAARTFARNAPFDPDEIYRALVSDSVTKTLGTTSLVLLAQTACELAVMGGRDFGSTFAAVLELADGGGSSRKPMRVPSKDVSTLNDRLHMRVSSLCLGCNHVFTTPPNEQCPRCSPVQEEGSAGANPGNEEGKP